MEGPEIPNIRPPPPTAAMIAKSMTNNITGTASVIDVYGNAYENPLFSFDPVFRVLMQFKNDLQSAVEARMQKKMNQEKKNRAENDIEVPTDRFTPLNVDDGYRFDMQIQEENRKYMERALPLFDMASLTIPKYTM